MPLNSGAQGSRLDIWIWKISENTESHNEFSLWRAELESIDQTWSRKGGTGKFRSSQKDLSKTRSVIEAVEKWKK